MWVITLGYLARLAEQEKARQLRSPSPPRRPSPATAAALPPPPFPRRTAARRNEFQLEARYITGQVAPGEARFLTALLVHAIRNFNRRRGDDAAVTVSLKSRKIVKARTFNVAMRDATTVPLVFARSTTDDAAESESEMRSREPPNPPKNGASKQPCDRRAVYVEIHPDMLHRLRRRKKSNEQVSVALLEDFVSKVVKLNAE